MKKDDLILNIIIKTVILILFVWFSFYKMRINLFVIIAELFTFVFLNSFVLNEKKISFNMELFCFQGMLVFLFERPIIFYWDGIPDNIYEKNFYNYNYVIYSFLFFIILVFIFFKLKKDIFWKEDILEKSKVKQPYISDLAKELCMDGNVLSIDDFIKERFKKK